MMTDSVALGVDASRTANAPIVQTKTMIEPSTMNISRDSSNGSVLPDDSMTSRESLMRYKATMRDKILRQHNTVMIERLEADRDFPSDQAASVPLYVPGVRVQRSLLPPQPSPQVMNGNISMAGVQHGQQVPPPWAAGPGSISSPGTAAAATTTSSSTTSGIAPFAYTPAALYLKQQQFQQRQLQHQQQQQLMMMQHGQQPPPPPPPPPSSSTLALTSTSNGVPAPFYVNIPAPGGASAYMPMLAPSHAATLFVNRRPAACRQCHDSRIRCNRERPCNHCVRRGIQCTIRPRGGRRACIECRPAKVRCDQGQPCGRCQRLLRVCIYDS